MIYAYHTDEELVALAAEFAADVMYWRERAAWWRSNTAVGPQRAKAERRDAMLRAKRAEARVVDCAIVAEQRCIREARP